MILTLKFDPVKRPDHETVDFELHLKVQKALREEWDKIHENFDPISNPEVFHQRGARMKWVREQVIGDHLAQKEPPVDNPDSPPNK
jgi:hypothetical protein